MVLNLTNPSDLQVLAKEIAKAMLAIKEPESEHITCEEARQTLGITQETLAARITEVGIATYRHGRGKAFDRKHLCRLR